MPEPFVLPQASVLERILAQGVLRVFTLYNTTDFYVYQGTTRGFHYELAQDFADYLGVKLQIVDVNLNLDTAIARLQDGKYDLLAMGLTQTAERKEEVEFCAPFFQTNEVLVQNRRHAVIHDLRELANKEVYIPTAFSSYRELLQEVQDSLQIRFDVIELDHYFNEDLVHLAETGLIDYTVIDENIAKVSAYSMPHIDYALRLRENVSISWAARQGEDLLVEEVDRWLETIRKDGKLKDTYNRYFEKVPVVPGNVSKYAFLRKGKISSYDHLIKKTAGLLGWDWRLVAAVIYCESHFDPEAQSAFGAYGLMQVMPFLSVCYVIAGLANLGLPGFSGFIAEMTIFVGSFEVNDVFHRTLTIIATTSIVITAVYILRLVGKVLYGTVGNPAHLQLTDATWDERLPLIVLIVAIAGLGLMPWGFSHIISDSVLPVISQLAR